MGEILLDISELSKIPANFLKLLKNHISGHRIIDLLLNIPRNYSQRLRIKDEDRLDSRAVDKTIIINLDIENFDCKSNRITKITGRHPSGRLVEIIYFIKNSFFLKKEYSLGSKKTIVGKLTSKNGIFQISHPLISQNCETHPQPQLLESIYHLTKGIGNISLTKLIFKAFDSTKEIPEWLPDDIIATNKFPGFLEALKTIHLFNKESTPTEIKLAKARLSFDEFLAAQFRLRELRSTYKKEKTPIVGDFSRRNVVVENLGFKLTSSQNMALEEIYADQISNRKMIRLLQGDVGSGKTIVALLAMLGAIEAGFQAILMVPTEIVAAQHFKNIKNTLRKANQSDIEVVLLTSSTKSKKKVIEQIKSGIIQIIIGTHAVFQEKVKFFKIGLIVIDEQHRFGVMHRKLLEEKEVEADVLLMTATPIPRSLSMAKYGYLDQSILTEKPIGRKPIQTIVISNEKILEFIPKIKTFISKGEKVYWVCPLIEESEKLDLTAITDRFTFLKEMFGDSVALVHGRLPENEAELIIENFANGPIDILVSTTVIEVGVDVSKATLMIIEDAQRFGLSQIHQLRGRVGRSDLESYCVLIYNKKSTTEIAKRRLSILKESVDGFRIAEEDLRLRGSGEFLGSKQSGFDNYKIAKIPDDIDILRDASLLAKHIKKTKEFELLLQIFGVVGVSVI